MANSKAFTILIAILIGLLLPAGHVLTSLIRYNLMIMLFFSFLEIQFSWKVVNRNHFFILLANILLPILFYLAISPINTTMAYAVFVIAMAPTAAVAPVITGFLKGNVAFVTTSVLITTPAIALILPILLPSIVESGMQVSISDVLLPVSIIIFGPLAISQIIKWGGPKLVNPILNWKQISFYLFLFNVFIASAKASHFIQNDQYTAWYVFVLIGVAIGCLCVFQFILGEKIGREQDTIASSLALGRKNTMFAIWIALTFLDPVVALGPIFYIFFQNAYNGWQIWVMEQKAKKKPSL